MLLQGLLACAAVLLFLQPIAYYLRDPKKLRKFPSPPTASLSSLWRIFYNLQYRHFEGVDAAHQKFGIHVRIGPNHLSISDPRAVSDIYGHGANFLKDAFYDGGAGEYRHMADARDKLEHQGKRKVLAHVFAQKTIAELEPIISDTIGTMITQLDKFAADSKPMNMRRYLNYFTIDVFSRLLTSESLGCLERGNDIVPASSAGSKSYQVPFIKSLHDATHINTFLGFEATLLPFTKWLFSKHPYTRAGADYENIIYDLCTKRLSDVALDSDVDIFSKLLRNNKNEPLNLPLGALLAEASVMMNAGTDTTTAALTNTIYLLNKNPAILSKLREELDEALGASTKIPTYSALSNLPYFRACVEESLRVRPASSMGLPRVVPEGGRVIAGEFVAAGVTVSVPTYTLLRNSEAFGSDAGEFRPDRWLTTDETKKAKMNKAHLPFSTGPRACIGRNIAYFEQLLLIATLVRNYDFDFVEGPGFTLKTLERFNGNPGEMEMWVRRRQLA